VNIFYLDRDPDLAAAGQCDKHVVKMILETAQLLSTAHHICGNGGPYKLTHQNHPSAVWARQSKDNYRWLYRHLLGLAYEYTERYGKQHKTIREHSTALSEVPEGIPDGEFTDPPQCMPDVCKRVDTVAAYRVYYALKSAQWADKGMEMRYYGR